MVGEALQTQGVGLVVQLAGAAAALPPGCIRSVGERAGSKDVVAGSRENGVGGHLLCAAMRAWPKVRRRSSMAQTVPLSRVRWPRVGCDETSWVDRAGCSVAEKPRYYPEFRRARCRSLHCGPSDGTSSPFDAAGASLVVRPTDGKMPTRAGLSLIF